ncbi:LuxR C-terminal-related transcriptional regulator [Streptomyces galilaeus]|uniref:LuxR C-terminal-related transcriptional regulator n=1 Tax=Streptomyces galilaeus TaxID=33899 RepID=UPI0038F72E97
MGHSFAASATAPSVGDCPIKALSLPMVTERAASRGGCGAEGVLTPSVRSLPQGSATRANTASTSRPGPMTERKCGVLTLISAGLSSTEIAQHLGITVGTVSPHQCAAPQARTTRPGP